MLCVPDKQGLSQQRPLQGTESLVAIGWVVIATLQALAIVFLALPLGPPVSKPHFHMGTCDLPVCLLSEGRLVGLEVCAHGPVPVSGTPLTGEVSWQLAAVPTGLGGGKEPSRRAPPPRAPCGQRGTGELRLNTPRGSGPSATPSCEGC